MLLLLIISSPSLRSFFLCQLTTFSVLKICHNNNMIAHFFILCFFFAQSDFVLFFCIQIQLDIDTFIIFQIILLSQLQLNLCDK